MITVAELWNVQNHQGHVVAPANRIQTLNERPGKVLLIESNPSIGIFLFDSVFFFHCMFCILEMPGLLPVPGGIEQV